MKKSVTMIPATKNKFTSMPATSVAKRKVAAYARVSTDSEEQLTSYEAQVDYYTKYIKQREEWEFVKVYTDEGISATNTKKRDGFNTMIKDALDGKIDLIVTKSVSRFARNTVDSLTTVRKLKEHGTEIYFEKENIYTFDSKGELLITIMSSLAQEESRSLSENVTWGQRKRFSDGKVRMNYKRFLGYEKGEDGKPVVNEAEAEIVRLIYRLFLNGKTPCGICRELERMGIPTVSGKPKWSQSTVHSILTNEKYKGDALLQKKFTVDFLTKKMKVNEGEVPQYYVEDSHPPIVTKLIFDIVQTEMARRQKLGKTYSGNSIYSSKVVCGDCGSFLSTQTATFSFQHQYNSVLQNGEETVCAKLNGIQVSIGGVAYMFQQNLPDTLKEKNLDTIIIETEKVCKYTTVRFQVGHFAYELAEHDQTILDEIKIVEQAQ